MWMKKASRSKRNGSQVSRGLIALSVISGVIIFSAVFLLMVTLSNSPVSNFTQSSYDVLVEMINGIACSPGTYEKVIVATEDIKEDAKNQIITEINLYFDSMIDNTDDYLDWYYSLGGQWSQIGKMIKGAFTGSVEEAVSAYMEEKLSSTLNPGFDLDASVNSIIQDAYDKVEMVTNSIVSENTIQISEDGNYIVTMDVTLEDIASQAAIDLNLNPMATNTVGIAGGIATGIIVRKVVKKVMTKAASKMAVKSATKLITPAIVGSAAGPIGTGIGIIAGLGFDVLTNKVDEAMNRAEYKAEIIEGINDEREMALADVSEYFASVEMEI